MDDKHQPRELSFEQAQYVTAHDIAWNTPYTNQKGTFLLGDLNIEHLRNIYKLLKAKNVTGELAVQMAKVYLVIERKEHMEALAKEREEIRRKKVDNPDAF